MLLNEPVRFRAVYNVKAPVERAAQVATLGWSGRQTDRQTDAIQTACFCGSK